MSYDEHLISMAGGDGEPEPVETVKHEKFDYGRLWPDGTFQKLGSWYSEKSGRDAFAEKSYEVKNVPESLRPVFARQRVVTTTEIYTAEAVTEAAP